MTVKQLEHKAITEKLLSEFVSLQPGTRSCTSKNIMDRYSVRQVTVEKALQYLKGIGYIDVTAGKGICIKTRGVEPDSLFDLIDLLLGVKEVITTSNINSTLAGHYDSRTSKSDLYQCTGH